MTFDLQDASAAEYQRAYEILASFGFSSSAPSDTGGQFPLPSTTWLGQRAESAAAVRDWIWTAFQNAGLGPKRMFVAKFDDWAGKASA